MSGRYERGEEVLPYVVRRVVGMGECERLGQRQGMPSLLCKHPGPLVQKTML